MGNRVKIMRMAYCRLIGDRRRCWEILLVFSALILPCFSSYSAESDSYRILLLLSSKDKVYELAADSLKKTLLSSAGRAIPFDIEKIALPDDIDEGLSTNPFGRKYDLIVPIGTSAAQAAKVQIDKTPVFNILTTKDAFDAIWNAGNRASEDGASEVSAIYLEQPVSRQIQFIRLALPHRKNCGVLLGNRSLHLSKDLRIAAEKSKLYLKTIDISATKKPIDGIRNIIKNNDVILAIPDAEALTPNIAKWLLYMAYQKEIPVIGFSKAIVDAGALGAIYTTPEQIGRQAAEIILRSALASLNNTDKTWRLPAPQYPEYFNVSINESVARSLKLNIQSGHYLAQSLIHLEQSETWRAHN